jgi:hypothetical protein
MVRSRLYGLLLTEIAAAEALWLASWPTPLPEQEGR